MGMHLVHSGPVVTHRLASGAQPSGQQVCANVGSTGFGAAGVAFGASGFAGFSANWLKQVSRSFSSFEKRQSVTTLAGTAFGLVCGGRIAS